MSKISVIITSFNQKDLLVEAIESVLRQTLPPYEVIVCDDASRDGSRELIAEYTRRYPTLIRAITHSENLGIARNRSSGLQAASGELITWLDGDDVFLPTKLEQEYAAFNSDPDVRWVYSQVSELREYTGEVLPRFQDPPSGYIFAYVAQSMGRAPRNMLVDAEVLREVGYFDPELSLYEDYDLLLRLAFRFKCAYCSQPGMEYRIHGRGVHRSDQSRHQQAFEQLQVKFLRLISGAPKRDRQFYESLLLGTWNWAQLCDDWRAKRIRSVAKRMLLQGFYLGMRIVSYARGVRSRSVQ